MIIETLPVGPLQANCYLVGCDETKTGVIIDPGDEGDRILRAVSRLGLTKISHVLLTHAHFDHIAAVNPVIAATGAALAMHPADEPLLQAGGGAAFFGLPTAEYPAPTQRLSPGDTIAVGCHTLRVLFTPGHSPGHVSFFAPQAGAVFDGDVLFAGSIGRSDLPGGSLETLLDSIAHQLMTLPDDTIVYPGHGPATTIGRERMSNPFL